MKCSTDNPSGCGSRSASHHIYRCVKIGVMIIAGITAVTWIVMQLWNCLLPDLFTGVSRIGYWQALGVLLLSRILFGGLRGGHGGHWRGRSAHWENMTPEEREQLKGRFRSRWSHCCSSSKDKTAENTAEAGDKPAGSA